MTFEKPENSMESTGANDPMMGTIEHGGFISETPPDVDEFLSETGLVDKAYVCTIKRAPQEGSASKEFLPGSLKGTYLPVEECGKRFGPGQYFYCFAWQTKDENGKPKKVFKEYKIYLGSEWDDIHDEYMAEKWAKKEKNIIKTAQQKKMRDAARGILPDDTRKEEKDPIENMKQTMEVMKGLGVPIGGNNLPASDNTNIMAMMMNMMNLNAQAMQKSAENTMNMMMQMSQNQMQMTLAMMKNNNGNDHNDIFKEIISMVQNTVDLKNALNPEKQSIVDRVFDLANSVLPAIVAIAKKPRAERLADPLVKTVKSSEDFAAMKNDPEMMDEAIKKWDAAHGPEQTDVILETIGLKRPGAEPSPPDVDIPEGEFSSVEPETTATDEESEQTEEPETDTLGNPVED